MSMPHGDAAEPAALTPRGTKPTVLDATEGPGTLASPLPAMRSVLTVFLIGAIVPAVASLVTARWGGSFRAIDPDDAFAWRCVHHVVQLILTLAVIAAWRRGALPRWGFNLNEWKTSLAWFGWFALFCTLGVICFEVVPHLLRGTAHPLDFPLNPRNAAGRLGFYYLLSGTGEEPLFRGFAMGVLLLYWRREFRVGPLTVPAAGLWATLFFMLAHVGYTLQPLRITTVSLPQQALALVLGLYYAAALYRTRSLLCPVLAHNFSNGIIFTLLYALAWWYAPPQLALPQEFETGKAGDTGLAEVLEKVRDDNKLPALAAVSMDSKGVIEMAAVGMRAESFPEQVTLDDRWHLGSITKPLTATLAARLVEKGVISWETTVEEVFPDLKHTNAPRVPERAAGGAARSRLRHPT